MTWWCVFFLGQVTQGLRHVSNTKLSSTDTVTSSKSARIRVKNDTETSEDLDEQFQIFDDILTYEEREEIAIKRDEEAVDLLGYTQTQNKSMKKQKYRKANSKKRRQTQKRTLLFF